MSLSVIKLHRAYVVERVVVIVAKLKTEVMFRHH